MKGLDRKSKIGACSVLCACAVLAAAACAQDKPGFKDTKPAPFPEADASETASCETVKCSLDLKKVVSGCDDQVVIEECKQGLGCAEGKCIEDACRSAELSKGSVGCSFYAIPPPEQTYGSGQCFAAIITNTWDLPVTISAELDQQSLDISNSIYTAEKNGTTTIHTRLDGPLPRGAAAVVFLAEAPNAKASGKCPRDVVPAVTDKLILDTTGRTHAIRLRTTLPVSAYSIFPYGGAPTYIPTATLLLPTSAWSTNYIAVDGWPSDEPGQRPFLQIVADEDDTVVRMRPIADIGDGVDVLGTPRDVTQSWTLSRGEVLQITQIPQLIGSPIESNKPVGLFGGSQCTAVPRRTCCCDTLQQQIPPLSQWGSEYALVPYLSRLEEKTGSESSIAREKVPYRLVGAIDGTKLTYDPERPVGAPDTLSKGEAVVFTTDRVVTVRSQDDDHPFYAAVYMTGSQFNSGTGTVGDPDFVNIVPSNQFLDRYIFSTDYSYADTTLTFVRKKTSQGFEPVVLDCAGEVSGWRSLDSKGEYEFAWVRITHAFTPEKFGDSSCGYGRHEAKSNGPFSVTVWGLSKDASYGYPGGMGLRPVNTVTVPVPN